MRVRLVYGISHRFPWLFQSLGQVAHVLLSRSPLIRPASWPSPFDLHVLSTPPAFVLSQNQNLRTCLHGTPPPKDSRATDTRTAPDKDQSDSAELWHRLPRRQKKRHQSQPRPTTSAPTPQTGHDHL